MGPVSWASGSWKLPYTCRLVIRPCGFCLKISKADLRPSGTANSPTATIRALIIRLGFWGFLYYTYMRNPKPIILGILNHNDTNYVGFYTMHGQIIHGDEGGRSATRVGGAGPELFPDGTGPKHAGLRSKNKPPYFGMWTLWGCKHGTYPHLRVMSS